MTTKKTDILEQAEAEAQSEIDQILNEVEELRRELNQESSAAMADSRSAEVPASEEDQEPAVESVAESIGDESDRDDEELMKEFHAAFEKDGSPTDSDAGMEETLSELKHDPEAGLGPISEGGGMTKSLLDQTFEDQENRTNQKSVRVISSQDLPATGGPADGSLTMTLRGNMTLTLQYECDGREVTIGFADSFLRIALADGTEFKIPVRQNRAMRRVG